MSVKIHFGFTNGKIIKERLYTVRVKPGSYLHSDQWMDVIHICTDYMRPVQLQRHYLFKTKFWLKTFFGHVHYKNKLVCAMCIGCSIL